MKHLKKFNESQIGGFPYDPDEIIEICEGLGIEPYHIHPDGTVDVDDDVDLKDSLSRYIRLKRKYIEVKGRIPIKFGYVTGNFNAENCKLTTLAGSPHTVGGDFLCKSNDFPDLIGGPSDVGGIYDVSWNRDLTSLEGVPRIIKSILNIGISRVWDVRPLKDVRFERVDLIDRDCFVGYPATSLVELFAGNWLENFQNFLESLDYNYIKDRVPSPEYRHGMLALDLFRFREAMSEFDLDIEKFGENHLNNFESWHYFNGGIRVNFDGVPIYI